MMNMEKEFHPEAESFEEFQKTFGKETISIKVAHLSLTFDGLDRLWKNLIGDMYQAFAVPSSDLKDISKLSMTSKMKVENIKTGAKISVLRSERTFFLPLFPGEIYRIEFFEQGDLLFFWSYHFACRYNQKNGYGHLAICAQESLNRKRIIENFMRVILSLVAIENESFFLHSSGIVRNDKAHIFFGPSGSGKTTIALFSKGMPLLSDDQVLVYLKAGSAFASGVPFSGGERFRQDRNAISYSNINKEFEIAGFYWLVKNKENFLEPLSLVIGATKLASAIPFIKDSPFPMQKALDIATEIAKASKIFALHFKKDGSFWDII